MGVKSFSCTAFGVGGGAASGALCNVYTRNTTTRKTVYSDSTLVTPFTNPVVGDSDGRIGPVYFDDTLEITFRVTTSDGATRLLDVDFRDGTFNVTYVQSDQLQLFEQTKSGDGSTKTFVLSGVVASTPYHIDITFNSGGTRSFQPKSSYSVSSDGTDTTVVFDTAPASGTDNIVFTSAIMQGVPGPMGPPGDQLAIYDTLAAIMALNGSDLDAGAILATRGHQAAMDGCGAEYVIYATLPLLSDGVTSHPVDNLGLVNALTGSKWAINREYIQTRRISCPMFGADGRSANQKTFLDNWFNTYKSVQTTATGGTFFGDDLQVVLYAPAGRWASSTEVMYAPVDDQFRLEGAGSSTVFENIGFQLDGLLDPLIENLAIDGLGVLDRGIYLGATTANNKATIRDIIINNCTVAGIEVRRDIQSQITSFELYNSGTAATSGTGNLVITGTGGTLFTDGMIHSGKFDNIHINPAVPDSGAIGVGEVKMVAVASFAASRYNLYGTGTDTAQWWESYFDNCTFTLPRSSAKNPRSYTVSSITNNGGFVQFNFAGSHKLSKNMSDTVSPMTFTGASLTLTGILITQVISSTAVLTNKVYTANDTGTLTLQNFDIYIDGAGSTAEGVFDIHFNSGNANYVHVGKSNQVKFGKTFRIKQQRYQTTDARNVDWPSNSGGFYNDFTATEVNITGPGAAQAWAKSEFVPGSNASPSAAYWRMRAPNYAAGIAANQEPVSTYNVNAKQDGVNLGLYTTSSGALTGANFDGTVFNFLTAGAAGLPIRSAQTKATGSSTDRTLEDRANDLGFSLADSGGVANNSTDNSTALTAQLARRTGTADGTANASVNDKPLFYGSGAWSIPSQTITTNGTGQSIRGSSMFTSRLVSGSGVVVANSRFALSDISLTGSGTYGIRLQNLAGGGSRASGYYDMLHIRDKQVGISAFAGDHDFFNNFLIESCNWGVEIPIDSTAGNLNLANGRILNTDSWAITTPDGQTKLSNITINSGGAGGLYIREKAAGAASVESYFSQISSSGAKTGAFYTLTGSASNIGGGLVRFTVTSAFYNRVGDYVTIQGTTNYNNTYTIVAVSSDFLTFDVTVAYVAESFSGTGVVKRKYENIWRITGVTNAGGGNIQITTDGRHTLRAGLTQVVIAGTTDYDGTKTVVAVTGTTTFTVAATYTSSKTGTCALPNNDLVIDGVGDPNNVNDMFFIGGNFNYTYIGSAYAVSFIGTRLKQVIWKESANAARIFIVRNRRGRDEGTENLLDVPVIGPGSYRGWGEIAYSDDATEGDGGMMVIAVPHEAAGVGTDNLPTLNELRVKEDGHELTVNGSVRHSVTDTATTTTNPLQVNSGTATPAGGTAGTGIAFGSAGPRIIWGSGAPTASAAQGSLYIRTDGSSTSTRMYINTNGSTTWTAVTTAA